MIQFFTGFDTPVSYNPFDNFISVPMKAFGDATAFAKAVASLDLSKIIDAGENISVNDIKTILGGPSSILFSGYKKWANVINVRIKIPGPPWVDKDKIVVKKIWKNDKESTRPDWIKIHVYAGDEEIAGSPVVMNKKDYAGQSEWVGRIKLNEEMIKHLHYILKHDTADSRLAWFAVGEYKQRENVVGGRETAKPSEVHLKMKELLAEYHAKPVIAIEDIIAFHARFEQIHPFQDGNGRVGRLIALKECLGHNVIPFIIEDSKKLYYYRGLREWGHENGWLTDTCLDGQDTFAGLLDMFGIHRVAK